MALLYLAEAYCGLSDIRAEQTVLRAESILGAAQNRHGRAVAPLGAAVLLRRLNAQADVCPRLDKALALARATEYEFYDVTAKVLAERAEIQNATGDPNGLGVLAVKAVAAAARFGPHLADEILTRVEPILRSLNATERASAHVAVAEMFVMGGSEDRTAGAEDAIRRAEEGFAGLGHAVRERIVTIL